MLCTKLIFTTHNDASQQDGSQYNTVPSASKSIYSVLTIYKHKIMHVWGSNTTPPLVHADHSLLGTQLRCDEVCIGWPHFIFWISQCLGFFHLMFSLLDSSHRFSDMFNDMMMHDTYCRKHNFFCFSVRLSFFCHAQATPTGFWSPVNGYIWSKSIFLK